MSSRAYASHTSFCNVPTRGSGFYRRCAVIRRDSVDLSSDRQEDVRLSAFDIERNTAIVCSLRLATPSRVKFERVDANQKPNTVTWKRGYTAPLL